jgi:high-affinity nickel-transport protein
LSSETETRAVGTRSPAPRLILAVVLLCTAAWGVVFVTLLPAMRDTMSVAAALALASAAFGLGMRHGFDADHIAAIDNVTRRLTSLGRASASVGFWFAMGHSSVVFAAAMILGAGANALMEPNSEFLAFAAVWGPAFSGCFLLAVASLNAAALVRLRRRSHGPQRDTGVAPRGVLARSATSPGVTRPWHMYVVGLLFGLGFDTATSVVLIITASAAAGPELSFAALGCLPLLFAAGMAAVDTIDGLLMARAYRWSSDQPHRRIRYDIVVTSATVLIGLAVAVVQLVSAIGTATGARNALLTVLDDLDPALIGLGIVLALGIAVALGFVAATRSGNRGGEAVDQLTVLTVDPDDPVLRED